MHRSHRRSDIYPILINTVLGVVNLDKVYLDVTALKYNFRFTHGSTVVSVTGYVRKRQSSASSRSQSTARRRLSIKRSIGGR
jgi:hypothetical protein